MFSKLLIIEFVNPPTGIYGKNVLRAALFAKENPQCRFFIKVGGCRFYAGSAVAVSMLLVGSIVALSGWWFISLLPLKTKRNDFHADR